MNMDVSRQGGGRIPSWNSPNQYRPSLLKFESIVIATECASYVQLLKQNSTYHITLLQLKATGSLRGIWDLSASIDLRQAMSNKSN
jgi:hypothetical protein